LLIKAGAAAADAYLKSGRFGFFRRHGQHGKNATFAFMTTLARAEVDLPQAIGAWLKTSGYHRSSRVAFAYDHGLLTDGQKTSIPFRNLSQKERKKILADALWHFTAPEPGLIHTP
jgi:hypothetical protein